MPAKYTKKATPSANVKQIFANSLIIFSAAAGDITPTRLDIFSKRIIERGGTASLPGQIVPSLNDFFCVYFVTNACDDSNNAAKYPGAKVVRVEWLTECLKENRVLNPNDFSVMPKPKININTSPPVSPTTSSPNSSPAPPVGGKRRKRFGHSGKEPPHKKTAADTSSDNDSNYNEDAMTSELTPNLSATPFNSETASSCVNASPAIRNEETKLRTSDTKPAEIKPNEPKPHDTKSPENKMETKTIDLKQNSPSTANKYKLEYEREMAENDELFFAIMNSEAQSGPMNENAWHEMILADEEEQKKLLNDPSKNPNLEVAKENEEPKVDLGLLGLDGQNPVPLEETKNTSMNPVPQLDEIVGPTSFKNIQTDLVKPALAKMPEFEGIFSKI